MIEILLLNTDNTLEEIKNGELHWSDILELDAKIIFSYDEKIIEFETMHHHLTLESLIDGIRDLLLSGKQSSYSGYGASYNKSLVLRKEEDKAFIESHIRKGEFQSIKVSPRVVALDYIKAFNKHMKHLAGFKKDPIGSEDLENLVNYISVLKDALNRVSS